MKITEREIKLKNPKYCNSCKYCFQTGVAKPTSDRCIEGYWDMKENFVPALEKVGTVWMIIRRDNCIEENGDAPAKWKPTEYIPLENLQIRMDTKPGYVIRGIAVNGVDKNEPRWNLIKIYDDKRIEYPNGSGQSCFIYDNRHSYNYRRLNSPVVYSQRKNADLKWKNIDYVSDSEKFMTEGRKYLKEYTREDAERDMKKRERGRKRRR